VRSVTSDAATTRSSQTTPTPWDRSSSHRGNSVSHSVSHDFTTRGINRDPSRRDSKDTTMQRERIERLAAPSIQQHQRPQQQLHSRNDSSTTGAASSDYNDTHHGRRHDYDVQAMESDLSPRPGAARNPIPPPVVTVRSEFPTLTRSRQQQPLTCLVTIESPEGSWHPEPELVAHTANSAILAQEELQSPQPRNCVCASTIGTASNSSGMFSFIFFLLFCDLC
jgi:hypothetical protein